METQDTAWGLPLRKLLPGRFSPKREASGRCGSTISLTSPTCKANPPRFHDACSANSGPAAQGSAKELKPKEIKLGTPQGRSLPSTERLRYLHPPCVFCRTAHPAQAPGNGPNKSMSWGESHGLHQDRRMPNSPRANPTNTPRPSPPRTAPAGNERAESQIRLRTVTNAGRAPRSL